jgi:hypothetical protein
MNGDAARIVELEIALQAGGAQGYPVELRLSRTDDEAQVTPTRGLAQLDLKQLRVTAGEPDKHGKLLSEGLLVQPEIRRRFRQACDAAEALDCPLRIRLWVDPGAPELHNLRWETLWDLDKDRWSLTDERVRFSRYLSSDDLRPEHLRPRQEMRALVVIANPTAVAGNAPEVANPADGTWDRPENMPLAAIDVAGELKRARENLDPIPVKGELASGGKATLEQLTAKLADGYDVLYLVCHGAFLRGDPEPSLWLEDDRGNAKVVKAGEVVRALKDLEHRPRLVVLASCQSAGADQIPRGSDRGMLAALGPRLAEAGIPAVLAMQGSVTMETAAKFLPAFFRELRRDGILDRAMSVARGEVRGRPDAWMPALFLRLKRGRIWWYTPGLKQKKGEMSKWPALLSHIDTGECTPILGPGVTEFLFGPWRDLARTWADTYAYPMAAHQRDDLAQVAEYLTVNQSPNFVRAELVRQLRQEVRRRHPAATGPSLDELIVSAWQRRRRQQPREFFTLLARIPFAIYLTASPDPLLPQALAAAGRKPEVGLFPWQEDIESRQSVFAKEPGYIPDQNRPLVYYFFGRYREPSSLVLTEDDYFDYLISMGLNWKLFPEAVSRRLNESLLFLGFHIDDWSFRALFRSIIRKAGGSRRGGFAHVAVQIDPVESRHQDLKKARHYFRDFLGKEDVTLYWGSAEDFARELGEQWQQWQQQQAVPQHAGQPGGAND